MSFQMSGSVRKALPDKQEWSEDLLHVRVWSGGHPGCPGVVGRPSQMSVSVLEALPYVR